MREPGTDERKEVAASKMGRLKLVLFLTSGYFAAQIVIAILTHSLVLLADSTHVLTDIGGLGLSLIAVYFTRKPASPKRTYGYYRMEILASLINSLVLLLLSAFIMYEAYKRFFEPPVVDSFPVIIVAGIGFVVNILSMRVLGGHPHSHSGDEHNHKTHEVDLNIATARLEVLSDTVGSAIVIVAGIVMLTTNFYLADPIAAMGLAIFIVPRTWTLIKKSLRILMEEVPAHLSYDEIKQAILELRGVTGIFELHIWTITSGMNALSAHVVIHDRKRSQEILQDIAAMLEKRFGVNHSTIQIETYHPESEQF